MPAHSKLVRLLPPVILRLGLSAPHTSPASSDRVALLLRLPILVLEVLAVPTHLVVYCFVSHSLVYIWWTNTDRLVTQFWNGGSASYGPADSWTIHGEFSVLYHFRFAKSMLII